MAHTNETSMAILIVFPEDTLNSGKTHEAKVRSGGDVLEGYLEVTTGTIFDFEIDVSFEGLVRTWQSYDTQNCTGTTAEYQLLKETQTVGSSLSLPGEPERYTSRFVYHLPFRFVVPRQLISARSDVHPHFLNLSPSAKLGSVLNSSICGKIFMQPMIMYFIKATLAEASHQAKSTRKCHDAREIVLIPSIPAAPPLSLNEYPREYRPHLTATLKRRMWSRPIGQLNISAREPQAINVSTATPRASTTVFMELRFDPCTTYESEVRPFEWDCDVEYYVRSRTFYSIKVLDEVPSISMVESNENVRMYSKVSKSEIRQSASLSWRLDRLSRMGVIQSSDENCPWVTTLVVPINASKTLTPTFLNPLSARRYSLLLKLSIKGFSHSTMELELPLQVVSDTLQYSPPVVAREAAMGLPLDYCGSHDHGSDDLAAHRIDSETVNIPIENDKLPPYTRY
ncbi:hypothetical protein MMC27_006108 [Xylographa pallens]|nr:hypothetical protein [Xylographa pallens]